MSYVDRCPVACPVVWTITPGISRREAASCSAAPTTLLTWPSVGACERHCPASPCCLGHGHLSASLHHQRGGSVACPFASRAFFREPSRSLPLSSSVPAKEGFNLVVAGRLERVEGRS